MLIRLVMYILFGVFTNKYVPFNIFWSHSHVLLEIFQNVTYIVSVSIVLKLGSVIDSAGVLGHWVNGRTTESLVEPHD